MPRSGSLSQPDEARRATRLASMLRIISLTSKNVDRLEKKKVSSLDSIENAFRRNASAHRRCSRAGIRM